jgi:hypothetical protein
MATRMQQRRGTATQWTSTNDGDGPILEVGEIGFETDTGKFKIGDGINRWIDLDYFLDESEIDSITGDYVLSSTLGQNNGVATLDGSGKLTSSQIPTSLATTNYVDTAVSNLIDAAPGTLDTLNELAAAINDDASFASTITTSLGNKQDKVTGVSDTEIGYLANVNADIQSQLDSKLASADLDEAAQEAVNAALVAGVGLEKTYNDNANTITLDIDSTVTTNDGTQTLTNKTLTSPKINEDVALTATATELNVLDGITASTTELNYVDGVTSAIQTQLDDKLSKTGGTMTGDITLVGAPTQALHPATKAYVDNAIEGLVWKTQVNLLSDSDTNMTGSTGTLVIDGHSALTQSDNNAYRILLTNQDIDAENGIYVYTDNGSTYTLVRADDANTYDELIGASVYILEGTTYGGTAWIQSDHYITTFAGQDWVQFSGAGTVTAGNGISVNGLQVSIDTATTVDLDTAQTLTNKTIDAGNNTISNIPNASLDNSSITINGESVSLGGTATIPTGFTSQAVSSNISLQKNYNYFVDTSAARTLTLPASPTAGDEIHIFDATGTAATNKITVDSNGGKINGTVQDLEIDVNNAAVVIIYTGTSYGWRVG